MVAHHLFRLDLCQTCGELESAKCRYPDVKIIFLGWKGTCHDVTPGQQNFQVSFFDRALAFSS
jgi:hypothetical protein